MDYTQIEAVTRKVKDRLPVAEAAFAEIAKTVIGQKKMLERMMISLMCDGHILLEGLPGLAKTLAVRSFAHAVSASFSRIQFTPDLLPADLIGTQIYNPKDMEFFTRKGPVFCNILLADEINRAPAKVQSALLQAMEERQVTIGDGTHKLPVPFMVLATENPIEQEGTYPLPEAQLDRFLMKCIVEYPDIDEEKEIISRIYDIDVHNISPVLSPDQIAELRSVVESVYADPKIVDYVVRIVSFTRTPSESLRRYIEFGASPRASIALLKCSRAVAFFRGRGFVTPDDVKEIALDVLRHRIIPTYEAEAEGISNDDLVKRVLDEVEVP
jgi:MoxR-like ATPase